MIFFLIIRLEKMQVTMQMVFSISRRFPYMLSLRTSGPLHALVSINKLLNNEIIGTCAKNNGLDFYKVYV
jgi:hypothetical protein